MSKSTKNTVEVRVPRKRDGFKEHKTTVRMRVLPELPAGAPSPDGPKKPAAPGPEALGLPPHGPRVQLPTQGIAPEFETEGFEPLNHHFLCLDLDTGEVYFGVKNNYQSWSDRKPWRLKIPNNLDASQTVKFVADNEDVLQLILNAHHNDDEESIFESNYRIGNLADELVSDGDDIEKLVDDLVEPNLGAAEKAVLGALPPGYTVTFDRAAPSEAGMLGVVVHNSNGSGQDLEFQIETHPSVQGDLRNYAFKHELLELRELIEESQEDKDS